jgi:NAD(P)-dependent dehydrogenase (short-subunit alcohol dehydrogenase family)
MDFTVKGKVALVTGASRGIGKATALGLAQMGADVALASRKLPELERVAETIKGLGRKSIAVPSHLGKTDEIENLVKTVEDEFGKIDILVNNAGANPTMASALDIEERAWDVIMNLNLKGLFFLSQAVARIMKEHGGGNIINVSSLHGVKPSCLLPAYSISKAGVIAATKVMAGEWAKYNIRVNAVAPGLIKTEFSEALWSNDKILKEAMKKTPLARIGTPEDIASSIVYLASDASSYVTGEVLVVDGGNTI